MKVNVKSVVVLTVICVVVSALLSVTNFFTAPVIEANKAAAAQASLKVVMPDAAGFEEIALGADAPATVLNLYKETSGLGYVVILSTSSQYSSDNMGITVAIGNEGTITGITLTSYYESKDFGADYPQTYVGADSALNGVDTFAGVTYSSTALKNAITDAFNVLIASGAVAEGQKSDEQLAAEVMPIALWGCADMLGSAQVTEIDAAGFDAAYEANNGCGYIVLATTDAGKVVCAVNAFGDVACYDLEGNVTDGPVDAIKAAFPASASANADANEKNAQKAIGDGITLTPIESVPAFGCVTGAFTAEVDGQTMYVFNTKPLGYSNEVMEMAIVVDADGKIVNYRTISELILHEEYYSTHELTDKEAYKNQFVGLDSSSYSDDMTIVAGATFTADAVADSINSAFEAYKAVKGAN